MEASVVHAARQFGHNPTSVESLTEGLIHSTYKITDANGTAIILQQVNTSIFKKPEGVITNCKIIYNHLRASERLKIPSLLQTIDRQDFWIDSSGVFWRSFEYVKNTSTEVAPTAEKIYSAAKCYGGFTQALSDLDVTKLSPTIPGFHDLSNRFAQLIESIATAEPDRLQRGQLLLTIIEKKKALLVFYEKMMSDRDFKLRPMHHDAKLSNILFDTISSNAVCPIDLDTTMPGYFFSDMGDMIRSMVPDADEHSSVQKISIRKDYYRAIISGYHEGMGNTFTVKENSFLHHSGLIMIYMQGIRFLTDYLANDMYYKTEYPEQNFDRASNQFSLFESLEVFLKEEFNHRIT